MIASDKDIRRRLESRITPFEDDNVQPCSYDISLGETFLKQQQSDNVLTIDGGDSMQFDKHTGSVTLQPHDCVLATTKESVSIPRNAAATVCGRSSLGRMFVSVHQTAGYIDAGFEGEITLELVNHGRQPVKLYEGDTVAQLVFHELSTPSEQPYDGEYSGQSEPTPSQWTE